MLDHYLKSGETVEGRIDELLTDVRASGTRNPEVSLARLTEASVLANLIPAAVTSVSNFSFTPSSPAEMSESLGEPLYTTDDVAKALDGVFEGGQAPTVLRGAFLALLAGREPVAPVGSIEDTILLDPLADGTTPRLPDEEHPRSYVDTGADFDVEMPEPTTDDASFIEQANADDEEFPEFEGTPFAPTPEPVPTASKPSKKGGKKSAAQRATEEAGA